MKLLSIIILSCDRLDLLQKNIQSLIPTINYPLWELIVYNHPKDPRPFEGLKKGWLKLLDSTKGEYVLSCQDDVYYPDKWDWVKLSIELLEKYPEVGVINLRKDGDGKMSGGFKYVEDCGNCYFVKCIESCFSLTSCIGKKKVFGNVIKNANLSAHSLEKTMRLTYQSLGYKTLRLKCDRNGVASHTGGGKSLLGH